VIPTQLSFDNVTLLFPKKLNWEKWKQQKSDIPFSDSVVEFFERSFFFVAEG